MRARQGLGERRREQGREKPNGSSDERATKRLSEACNLEGKRHTGEKLQLGSVQRVKKKGKWQ